jgi:hypothetical protein
MMSGSEQRPQMPPPAVSTRPSGRSSAVEWYWRGWRAAAIVFHCPVAGSQRSAAYLAKPSRRSTSSSQPLWPPVARTEPSASTVRLCWRRSSAIGLVDATRGVSPLMSTVTADLVAGRAPPEIRIFPMSYIACEP